MPGLSTPERNVGLESSQSSNVHTMPIANRASFDGVTIALRGNADGSSASNSPDHLGDGLDDDGLPADLAHDECEIPSVS